MERAAREALAEEPAAVDIAQLGGLDHADLGEHRDLDHER
jgi:hypothetical protein